MAFTPEARGALEHSRAQLQGLLAYLKEKKEKAISPQEIDQLDGEIANITEKLKNLEESLQ